MSSLLFLLQLPHQLGLFAKSLLTPNPSSAAWLMLLASFANAVVVLLNAAGPHGTASTVQTAVLQQLTDAGLCASLDQVAAATVDRLEEYCTAAAGANAAAAAASAQKLGFDDVHLEWLYTAAAGLLRIQVSPCHAAHSCCCVVCLAMPALV